MRPGAAGAFTLLELQIGVVLLVFAALGLGGVIVMESRHLRVLEAAAPDGSALYLRSPGEPLARALGIGATIDAVPPSPEPSPPAATHEVSVVSVDGDLVAETLTVVATQVEAVPGPGPGAKGGGGGSGGGGGGAAGGGGGEEKGGKKPKKGKGS